VSRLEGCVQRRTDHGVEGQVLDPLLVVDQRSPAERHRGVERRQTRPEQGPEVRGSGGQMGQGSVEK